MPLSPCTQNGDGFAGTARITLLTKPSSSDIFCETPSHRWLSNRVRRRISPRSDSTSDRSRVVSSAFLTVTASSSKSSWLAQQSQ